MRPHPENVRHTVADCQHNLIDEIDRLLTDNSTPPGVKALTLAACRRALHAERICRSVIPLLRKYREGDLIIEEVDAVLELIDSGAI